MKTVFIAILLFFNSMCLARNKATIGVLDIRATGVSKKMTISITDLITQEVEQMGLYRVVPRNTVRTIIQEITDLNLLESSNLECLVDMGGILEVDLLISGSIEKSGNIYTISLHFVDIINREIIRSVTEKCTGAETELYNILGSSLIKLFAKKPDYGEMVLRYGIRMYQFKGQKGEFMVFSSVKGAQARVDGKLMDTTPLSRIDFPAGWHRVVVKKDDAFGAADILVTPEQPIKMTINMVKGAGNLDITSKPAGAKVLVDGEDKGVTPAKVAGVGVGVHLLTLKLDGHVTVTKKVFVGDKATKSVSINFQKSGCLELAAMPDRAVVLVNNKFTGTGPLTVCDVPAGKVNIYVTAKNYEDFEGAISLNPGETKRVDINLVHMLAILDVRTDPKGADVILNGNKVGATHYRDDDLTLDTYNMKVVLPTYIEIIKNFSAEENKRYEFSFNLEHTKEYLRAQKKKRMLIRKIIFGSLGTALAGAGYYMNMQVDKNIQEQDRVYEEYESTEDNPRGEGGDYQEFKEEWDALDKKVGQFVLFRTILYILSGCSYTGMGVSFVF